MQMNSCILGICIIIRAILVQKNLVLRLNIHGPICMRKKQLMLRVTKYRIICIVLIFKDIGFVRLAIFHSTYYQSTSNFLVFILRCSQYSHSVDFKQVELTQLRCMYTLVGVPQILSQNCILQEAHVSSLDQFYYSRFFSSCSVFQVICQNFCLKTSLLGTPNIFNCILRYQ